MGIRRQAREAAVQALYMCDSLSSWNPETIDLCFGNFVIIGPVLEYARMICLNAIGNISQIDAAITCASEHWSVSRMGRVDRSIMRVATCEMMFCGEIPAGVVINEAIEIAKRYSTEDAHQFINGVLDRVATNNGRKQYLSDNEVVDINVNAMLAVK